MDIVPEDMTAADVAEVVAIEKASTPSPWSEKAFRAELVNAAARCRVLRAGGAVISFAVSWRLPGEVQVAELAVHPDHRRRGLGRILMEDLLAAADGNADVVTLEVRAGNAAARRLYESLDFTTTSRRPKFYEGREDAILMEKRLR